MIRRLVLLLLLPAVALALPPLDRNPSDYFAIGLRSARLKNLTLSPGCNVGVNCAKPLPRARCGTLRGKGLTIGAPGQAVADDLCSRGSFFEVFRNNPASACEPGCPSITDPGSKSDCTEGFTTPLIGDLDGDSTPSCDSNCKLDLGDIAVACNVTLPFPACDPGHPVVAQPGQDCGADDLILGNNQCDLKTGVYGKINLISGGHLEFAAGQTVICGLFVGFGSSVTASGPATVLVPGNGKVRLGNNGNHGSGCGMLRFVAERGDIIFGKYGSVDLDACSLDGKVRLGHGNKLRGHFIGDLVASNRDNFGECCPAIAPIPTTTTTTTSTTTTTTTTTSTTSSTTTTTTSTTTTTTMAAVGPCLKLTKTLNGPYRTSDDLFLSDKIIPFALQHEIDPAGPTNDNPENAFYFLVVLTVKNCGTTAFTNVVLTDGFSNQAQPFATSDPGNVVISPPPDPNNGTVKETLTWTIGTLNPGAMVMLEVKVGTEFNSSGNLEPTSAPDTLNYNGDGGDSAVVTNTQGVGLSVGTFALSNGNQITCVGSQGQWDQLLDQNGPNVVPHDKCTTITTALPLMLMSTTP